MFALFYSLYLAMFRGSWQNYDLSQIFTNGSTQNIFLKKGFDTLGTLATSIFGNNTYTTLGVDAMDSILNVIAFVLALITSIGIVVMAVKGVKKAFGIFFMGINRL